MADIVERLKDFRTRDHERGCQGREYVCACGYDADLERAVAEAADEITALRARAEAAEKERDELRNRVNFTLTDHQRLLQRSDIQNVCETGDLCFAEGGPVRCGPCAVKQSLAEGVKCLDWLPFAPEQYRLKRRAEAAENLLEEAVERADEAVKAANALQSRAEAVEANSTLLLELSTARKAWLDATAVYNSRLEVVKSERERGNHSMRVDAEYHEMNTTQSAFWKVAQRVADTALNGAST